jgi:hypothetical protein
MIIHKIEIECIAFVKAKNHAPIATDCNAPIVREIAFQAMQTPAWKQSDVFDGVRRVNGREHVTQLVGEVCRYRAPIIALKEPPQTFVVVTPVKCQLTDVNWTRQSNIQRVGLGELGALLDEFEARLGLVAHQLIDELARALVVLGDLDTQ